MVLGQDDQENLEKYYLPKWVSIGSVHQARRRLVQARTVNIARGRRGRGRVVTPAEAGINLVSEPAMANDDQRFQRLEQQLATLSLGHDRMLKQMTDFF
ncbi:hypothetical protein L484_005824 [Morus notabilis]|uniref:Uncharacterized protein n=1 Tax=Morus notabilis TaxID=981085 RepID=W9RWH7_9ROSA|nr:hypothetical protein L484_005824 [Morus notabilis]